MVVVFTANKVDAVVSPLAQLRAIDCGLLTSYSFAENGAFFFLRAVLKVQLGVIGVHVLVVAVRPPFVGWFYSKRVYITEG